MALQVAAFSDCELMEALVFHMIYTSKESPDYGPLNLKKLLVNARMRNSEACLTGLLIYHEGTFLQVIEGAELAVRKTFARIEKDVRHQDLAILGSVTTFGEVRQFGDWSMGFHDETGSAPLLKGFLAMKNTHDLTHLDEAQAMNILKYCTTNYPRQTAGLGRSSKAHLGGQSKIIAPSFSK
jgi:hypothetical protein